VLVLSACSGSTSSPSATTAASEEPVPQGNVAVRWFVGLGSGSQAAQIGPEQAFVKNYNATNKDKITLKLEIVPNANAYDVLKTEIAAGNAPDIIGPVGVKGRNGFEGLFLDLAPQIAANSYDLSSFDQSLVDFFKQGGNGQVGLPYLIYPGYIWYNKDLFTKAGIGALPTKVGDKFDGQDWTWATLRDLAQKLTLDKNGKKSTDAGFDAANISQYGFSFQWLNETRRPASCFGGGSFVADDGKTAQIPAVWKDAMTWYYNAIWTDHISPAGAAINSTYLGSGNLQSSGHIAMNAAWGWSIGSIAGDKASSKVKNWDIAVMPSYNGTTTSPMDADTFTITKASKNPTQAFKAMVAIMADASLQKMYGGMPASKAAQAAYFTAFDADLAKIFDNNPVTWSVLQEMAKYPAVPSHEANMPNFTKADADVQALWTKFQTTKGLNVETELATLKDTLQTDFNNAQSIYTDAP
jgi:multiple sugar transport system substrate-binding protein